MGSIIFYPHNFLQLECYGNTKSFGRKDQSYRREHYIRRWMFELLVCLIQ